MVQHHRGVITEQDIVTRAAIHDVIVRPCNDNIVARTTVDESIRAAMLWIL